MSRCRICPRCFGCGVRRGLRPAQGLRLRVEALGLGGLSWARAEPRSVPVPKSRTLEAPANAQPWCSSRKAELQAEPGPDISFPGGSGCSASLLRP